MTYLLCLLIQCWLLLFYRISSLTLAIPALRNRVEDIIPLALHFIQRDAASFFPSTSA